MRQTGERLHVKLTLSAPHLLAGILWKQRRLRLRKNHKVNSSGKDLCSAGWMRQWDTASRDLTTPQQCWKLLQGARGFLLARSRAINQSLVTRERKRTSMDPAEVTSNFCRWGSQRKHECGKRLHFIKKKGCFCLDFQTEDYVIPVKLPSDKTVWDSFVCPCICNTWSTPRQRPSGDAQPCRDRS